MCIRDRYTGAFENEGLDLVDFGAETNSTAILAPSEAVGTSRTLLFASTGVACKAATDADGDNLCKLGNFGKCKVTSSYFSV